ncbi:MAG: hypothetical protein HOG33_01180 [Candidatus Marinimicrobia bacterium]|jgi:hypothetical protein|nr:hypothetical protein [Candidatus Neomarinimicrobiota bacterium]MDG1136308.1 hypothetical protein [Bacteroidales bacterium]MBT3796983.1 hypothetical protein [Candidatus Neomarinimicrobiota bacterium]MBT4318061.1 hypothetical protein [Candidatus Neomarinimicrobiota bacterium]MBT4785215.1 hypothetical protein [Candidatus Neomarinimicrobiota bacterium]
MENIILFVRDFQKGAELSESLSSINLNVSFGESIYDLPDKCCLAIMDLDDKKFNNLDFILELKTKAKIKLICYKRLIKKESHDAIKNAGCDIIVTNASIVMNIQKLVKNLLK